MRLGYRAILPLVFLLSGANSIVQAQAQSLNSKYAPDRVLVKFRPSATISRRQRVHAAFSSRVVRRFAGIKDLELAALPTGMSVRQAIQAYRQRPEVEYVEPDYIVHAVATPDDPLFPQMWNLLNTGQNGGTSGADIGATSAWNLSTGSQAVVVAVIDTGIDYSHPDLSANVWADPSGFSTTANGVTISCAPGVHGFNAITGICDPMDDNGHGTHVSGTIGAAGNNALGVVGVNWNVQLISCKFLDANGDGSVSNAITCLDYVAALKQQGVNIVATNNSWGGFDYSQALTDAIQAQQQAGILFVAAAGNNFGDNDIYPTYPANTPLPNVISVAATTNTDGLAAFSNVGQHTVHLGAPGQQILSTLPGNTYGTYSGTSMASPHVTGAAALLAAQTPGLDWSGIKNLLLAGGNARSSLSQTISGNRLNVYGAMTCSGKTLTRRLQPINNAIAAAPGTLVTLEELNVDCGQPNGNVQVTVSPGGQVITLLDDGVGSDQAVGDGIYTAQWAPPAVGSYTLTFPGGDVVPVAVLNNYQSAPTSLNYRTISGTNLNVGDDGLAQITSPFPIPFGGGNFTTLQVGSNGTISFTDAYSPFLNFVLPTQTIPPITLVAPFWGDLYPVKGTAQNVFWAVSGTAPNRELVIEWRNVRAFQCHNDPSATVTFEVVFSESNSDVLFEYADTTFGGWCAGQDHGWNQTIGIQVASDTASEWSVDQQTVGDGTAIQWTLANGNPSSNPVPTLTSMSPTSAAVGGPSFTLTLTGSNFVPTSRVEWNSSGRVTSYVSSTQLTAQILPSDLASNLVGSNAYVDVVNPSPGGGQSGTLQFTVSDNIATIASISPTSVSAGSFDATITINGTNFNWFSSTAYWNGSPRPTFVVNSTQILTLLSSSDIASSGTGQLTVVNGPPGGGTSNAVALTIVPGGSASIYGQFLPLFNGLWLPQTHLGGVRSSRFLGWKYASKADPDYLKQFVRPRADAAPDASKYSAPSNLSSLISSSALPPAAGLQLHRLLPADFIPTAVVTGDFNSDGTMDWVVANGGSNNLWIYFGKGDGTFTSANVISLTGQSPVALAAADLRGVGKLDLVVAEVDSSSIGVLLGNGNGTFRPEQTYFVPFAPISLLVADFNHDSKLDIVMGWFGDGTTGPLGFLAGNGAGKFGNAIYEPASFFFPHTGYSIAASDFEKNGNLDIVVDDPGVGAALYSNDGTGHFKFYGLPINETFIVAPLAVAAGDVNEDGCPDVVALDTLTISRVFLGNCDGTFQSQSTQMGEGDSGGSVALADVNGDGHLDLIYSSVLGSFVPESQVAGKMLNVHFGDGKGNFAPAQVYRGGQTSFSLAVADVNKDGHPEVFTANQDSDSATLFLNDGNGGFDGPRGEYIGYINGNLSSGAINTPYTAPYPVDVNGDGFADLVLIQVPGGLLNYAEFSVMLNDGTGHFGPAVNYPGFPWGFSVVTDYVVADFRHTGRPDFVVSFNENYQAQGLVLLPNLGSGTFGPPQTIAGTSGGFLAEGDFNSDGNPDVVVVAATSSSMAQVTVDLGDGTGNFAPQSPANINLGATFISSSVWAGDFNHDGKLDILISGYDNVSPNPGSKLYELLGNGNGTFAAPKLVLNGVWQFVVADVNHDGQPDILDSRDPFYNYPPIAPPQFRVFLGHPDGSFTLNNTYAPYSGPAFTPFSAYSTAAGGRYTCWVGDFNGDGNLDIAAFQRDNTSPGIRYYIQYLLGNGDGTFVPTYNIQYLYASKPVTEFDFNNDGRTDVAELDGATSAFHVIPGSQGMDLQLALISDPVIGTHGMLRISLNMPSNGSPVTLAASDPAISIPASIPVPAGNLTQDVPFQIGSSFNSTHVFSIQGTYASTTAVAYGTQAQSGNRLGIVMGMNLPNQGVNAGQTTGDFGVGAYSVAGYSTAVNFSCQGLPIGATCQFGANPVMVPAGGGQGTSLFISTLRTVTPGTYNFTVSGTDGMVNASTAGSLAVSIPPPPTFSLTSAQSAITVNVGQSSNVNLTVATQDGFTDPVQFSCSGAPQGTSCTINPTSLVPSATGNIAILTVSVSTKPGSRSRTAGTR